VKPGQTPNLPNCGKNQDLGAMSIGGNQIHARSVSRIARSFGFAIFPSRIVRRVFVRDAQDFIGDVCVAAQRPSADLIEQPLYDRLGVVRQRARHANRSGKSVECLRYLAFGEWG